MARVKWGVLGCANFARRRTIPAMLETPSVELVGVASRTLEKAEALRSEFNLPRAYGTYREMLADPQIQAVYIPLPNGLHAEWMIKAAEAGKHSLCEKPFASNAAEARQVAEAAKRCGVFVMEAFMWRFHSQHLRARGAIERGEVGPLRLVRASFSFPIPQKPNVRLVPELAGGCVMDVGCYPISAARFYFGEEPSIAYARGIVDPEYRVDMRMAGVLDFPQGQALIDSSFSLPYRTELEIVGESGTITIPKPWLPDPEATVTVNSRTERLPAENQYTAEFEHLSHCILNGTAPLYGPEDAILQMKVIDAVRRSMESGRPEAV
jgi:D-xylose 1-dehydrogenase (NADP+, D-xylono-1,5-lactone-forming)